MDCMSDLSRSFSAHPAPPTLHVHTGTPAIQTQYTCNKAAMLPSSTFTISITISMATYPLTQ